MKSGPKSRSRSRSRSTEVGWSRGEVREADGVDMRRPAWLERAQRQEEFVRQTFGITFAMETIAVGLCLHAYRYIQLELPRQFLCGKGSFMQSHTHLPSNPTNVLWEVGRPYNGMSFGELTSHNNKRQA